MLKLNNNEKIEDLGDKELKIIQARDSYRFSVDSILLLNFIRVKNYEKIIDLGTGSGIIPLLLFGKRKGLSIYGIEIQKDLADMARRSVELNKLQNYITIIQEDFRNLKNIFKNQQFDVVISNPPYISLGQGKVNPSSSRAIARHEIKGDLEDIISVSNYLLKNKGRIYLIYKSSKLVKLIITLKKYSIEPKVVKFIHPRQGESANLVLLEGVKKGKEELKIEDPIFQY
ncbi:tRNA1(Val) (adenine(37)-N6)-methyltransferase [Candidatus Atribacteria bacterium MT.SAG.1]|nr:tRNA1(Val) (adenine(37)-N6)-methyltransferase [Candidatus Atribacteria bacterium MT.SAG.1]